jgi:hypothetical protein
VEWGVGGGVGGARNHIAETRTLYGPPGSIGMAPVQISVSPVCPSITLNDQKNFYNFDFYTLNGTLQVYFVLKLLYLHM